MKRIRLSLTGLQETLTEAAEKKLEGGESYQVPTCDNGKTEEFYNNLGVDLPPELIKKLKQQDNGIELDDEDFEINTTEILLWEDQIKLILTDDEFTTIFLNQGMTVKVLETANEIDSYISFLERSWFEKLKDSVYFFFRRLKYKLKTNKIHGN